MALFCAPETWIRMYTDLRSELCTREPLASQLPNSSLSTLLLLWIHSKLFLTNTENIAISWSMLIVWVTFIIYSTVHVCVCVCHNYNSLSLSADCLQCISPCFPYINPINLHDNTEPSIHHLCFLLERKDLHLSDVVDIASHGIPGDRIRICTLEAS